MRNFRYFILVIVLSCTGVAAQVSPTMPPPNPNLAGPSKHLPPSGADHPESTAGTIEGFVYWDVNSVRHTPANSCSGLAITVSVGSSSGGPFTAYTPLGTLSNNFKYVGQVKQFLVGGKIKVYDVCTYGYGKVPVGPNLRVTVNVTSPTAFLPASVPQNSIISPINIINAQCNMLPRNVNPTAADLFSKWGTCQNMAFDVNFEITNAAEPLSSSGGVQRGLGGAPVSKGPGPVGTTLLNGSGKPTLLNGPGSTPASQSAAGTQSQASSGMLLGNSVQGNSGSNSGTRQTYTGTTLGSTPGSNVEPNPQPFPPKQVLTNQDVLTMLNAGLAESVILSSLRSSPHKFDFSATSCRDLQRTHVTANILNAMGDGSVRPCPEITGTGGLNGPGVTGEATPGVDSGVNVGTRQGITDITNRGISGVAPGGVTSAISSSSPSRKGSRPTRTVLKPVKLPALMSLGRVTNPRLAQQNASIIAVLEQQRVVVAQESAAMKAGAGTLASAASVRAPVIAPNLQAGIVQGLGPHTTQSSGNIASNITHAPAFNSMILVCSNDPTPRIIQVNGGQGHGTIFTPESRYNLYTIVGCGLGKSNPGNLAYISSPNGFKANLNIDFWSDSGITAHLDPWLAGVLDQNNVTLVVAPISVPSLQKSGFTFYAARGMPGPNGSDQEVPLSYNSVPQSAMKLSSANPYLVAGIDQLPSKATPTFPSFSFQGTPVGGWVFRYAYGHSDGGDVLIMFDPNGNPFGQGGDCYINDQHHTGTPSDDCLNYFYGGAPTGSDTWEFSLPSAFSISSYELYYVDPDPKQLCGAWDDSSKDGGRDGSWDSSLSAPTQDSYDVPIPAQIKVTWPRYWCMDQEAAPFNRVNRQEQSSYGLAVWVWGPRCIDAWTQQKNQTCMYTVKKDLGG